MSKSWKPYAQHIINTIAKVGRRFRVFFRYDSASKTIVFGWVNDDQTLRSSGSKFDAYAVFEKMLSRGNPS